MKESKWNFLVLISLILGIHQVRAQGDFLTTLETELKILAGTYKIQITPRQGDRFLEIIVGVGASNVRFHNCLGNSSTLFPQIEKMDIKTLLLENSNRRQLTTKTQIDEYFLSLETFCRDQKKGDSLFDLDQFAAKSLKFIVLRWDCGLYIAGDKVEDDKEYPNNDILFLDEENKFLYAITHLKHMADLDDKAKKRYYGDRENQDFLTASKTHAVHLIAYDISETFIFREFDLK